MSRPLPRQRPATPHRAAIDLKRSSPNELGEDLELVVARKTLWRETACGAAGDPPPVDGPLVTDAAGVAPHPPGQAVFEPERGCVGESPVAVALEGHTLPPRHDRQLLQAEHDKLTVVANHGHVVVLGRNCAHYRQLHGVLEVDHLPALASLCEQLVGDGGKAAT